MTQIFITIETMKTLRRGTKGMGKQSSDERYIEKGHYPLVDNKPTYDTATQRVTSEDVVDEPNKVVNRVYTIIEIPQEELDAKLLARGERYIEDAIQAEVAKLNATYGVKFSDIHGVASYMNSETYLLAPQCKALWDWNESMWGTARGNQEAVIDGSMTEEEFKSALPVFEG